MGELRQLSTNSSIIDNQRRWDNAVRDRFTEAANDLEKNFALPLQNKLIRLRIIAGAYKEAGPDAMNDAIANFIEIHPWLEDIMDSEPSELAMYAKLPLEEVNRIIKEYYELVEKRDKFETEYHKRFKNAVDIEDKLY
ncbi:MAG: hypothetical protein SFU25_11025 [Candidatus Caenarcaniphilales bacterium]|nr:hypothetical protein [Candidatus Caenarcaniphilales bacterium]